MNFVFFFVIGTPIFYNMMIALISFMLTCSSMDNELILPLDHTTEKDEFKNRQTHGAFAYFFVPPAFYDDAVLEDWVFTMSSPSAKSIKTESPFLIFSLSSSSDKRSSICF